MSGMKELQIASRPELSIEGRVVRLEVAFSQLEDKVERMAMELGGRVFNAWFEGKSDAIQAVLDEVRHARQAVADAARAARRSRDSEGHKP